MPTCVMYIDDNLGLWSQSNLESKIFAREPPFTKSAFQKQCLSTNMCQPLL